VSCALHQQRARIGGLALSASRDPREYTRAARAAFLRRFEEEVDPERRLPEGERARRTEAARRLYFARLGLKSAQRRRGKSRGAVQPTKRKGQESRPPVGGRRTGQGQPTG
jgi:hypothetical protein